MNTPNHSPLTMRRKMQFFFVLPLVMIPLCTLLFWLLGGGAGDAVAATGQHTVNGLNLQLPAAHLKDESKLTKLDYYRRADQDSAKRLTLMKNDPYYRLARLSTFAADSAADPFRQASPAHLTSLATRSAPSHLSLDSDRNEVKVYRKLAVLNATLTKAAPAEPRALQRQSSPYSTELSRVEGAVQKLHGADTAVDPQLAELSKMVDKLVALQQGTKEAKTDIGTTGKSKSPTLPTLRPRTDPVDGGWSMAPDSTSQQDSVQLKLADHNRFYSLDEDQATDGSLSGISATVAETQTLVNGATLSMRLSQACSIGGIELPAGQPIFGTVQLAGERMTVVIKSIRLDERIIPVALSAFDMDGLAGVAIPDGIARQVAKQSADQSIESLGLTSVDQSFGAQAATAGLQAAKNLLSKKVRIVTVTIPAGYEVLLQDNQPVSHS